MEAALGCLLGVAVGDAAGATLEFESPVTAPMVEHALTLPGGGCWAVGPGQYTDDMELTLSLASGLCGHAPEQGFPTDSVAHQYTAWLFSQPFDCGVTCKTAFRNGPDPDLMREAAFQCSSGSKANGALMRAAPLAIWAHRLGDAAIAACAATDAMLSHPNRTCQDCSAAYCVALAHLIRAAGDSQGAVERAEAWCREHADPEVQQWLLQDSKAEDITKVVDAQHQAGFVKHGFALAFYHLRQRSSFAEGIRATLAHGGDTDTNAAIVGAMLGALWGAEGIPQAMSQPVLAYRYPAQGEWPGHDRPVALQPGRIPELAEALFQAGR
ncbi:hypothetical protein N2152v2_007233 [Parachlorella kessleri]